MKKIGITGYIGSGKTTACMIFEHLGIPVYYSDKQAKEAYKRFKTLETDKRAQYDYWIEDTLKLYMED